MVFNSRLHRKPLPSQHFLLQFRYLRICTGKYACVLEGRIKRECRALLVLLYLSLILRLRVERVRPPGLALRSSKMHICNSATELMWCLPLLRSGSRWDDRVDVDPGCLAILKNFSEGTSVCVYLIYARCVVQCTHAYACVHLYIRTNL